MEYVLGILWYATIGWLIYFYFISPIFKKYEKMELVDVIDGGEESFSFFFVGDGLIALICFAVYAICVPIVCLVQFFSGHTMGFGAEREFIFRKENGEIVSLRMRKDDLKFFGSSNYVIGDTCNVKYIKHMLQRVKVDKTNRMAAYQQVYGGKKEEISEQQSEKIENQE